MFACYLNDCISGIIAHVRLAQSLRPWTSHPKIAGSNPTTIVLPNLFHLFQIGRHGNFNLLNQVRDNLFASILICLKVIPDI